MNKKDIFIALAPAVLAAIVAFIVTRGDFDFKSKDPFMGPAMRSEVRNLLFGNEGKKPLPEGWMIRDFEYGDRKIEAMLEGPHGGELTIGFYHWRDRDAFPPAAIYLKNTLSFKCVIKKGSGAGWERAGAALRERVSFNDRSYFFDSRHMIIPESYVMFLLSRLVAARMTLGVIALACALLYAIFHTGELFSLDKKSWGILLSLVAGGALLRGWYGSLESASARMTLGIIGLSCALLYAIFNTRELFRLSKKSCAILFSIIVAGAALRFLFAPSAPVHCNSHGVEEIKTYLRPIKDAVEQSHYGHVFPIVLKTLLNATSNEEEYIFKINKVIGIAAVISFWMFAMALFKEEAPALLATAFFALSPAQVWMSGTEHQTILFAMAGFFGLATLIIATRKQSIPLLWLAFAAICLGSAMRVLTVALVPVAFLFAAYEADRCRGKDFRMFAIHAFQGMAILLVMVIVHVKCIFILQEKDTLGKVMPIWSIVSYFLPSNILYDPGLTPTAVPVLAVFGAIALYRNNKKLAIIFAAIFIMIVPLTFSVTDCRTTSLRYQSQAHWIYYILAAAVFSSAGPAWPAAVKKKLLAAVVFALVLNSAYGMSLLARGDEEMNEYWFLRKTAPKIAAGTTIYLPDVIAAGGKLITDFPGYMNDFKVVKGVPGDDSVKDGLVYLGLDCYRYDGARERKTDFTPDGLQKECANVCGGLRARTVYEKKLDARLPRIGFQKRFYSISKPFPVVRFLKCEP